MLKTPVVIVGMARTPQGNMLGVFKDLSAVDLGAIAIRAAIMRAKIKPETVTEVLMGCVLPAGVGQAPARQAALQAGLPKNVGSTTISKVCGSGMKAVMLAYDHILLNPTQIMIAGGMESMTNAPHLLIKARQGYRLGHAEIVDHMLYDGLEDAYEKGRPMGYFAESCAKQYGFTRKAQDAFATTSLQRATQAIQDKAFANEITPVTIKIRNEEKIIDTDEHPGSVNQDKIPLLKSTFVIDGTITAANSSSIADGAAALVLMSGNEAAKQNVTPLAYILDHASFAKEASEFSTAPIDAIQQLLKKLHWTIDDVDLFEINEAFAVVVMAAMQDLKIPHAKINIHGGGCALGHPIGATGARIIVTLVSAMQQRKLKRGIASLCIGGGEATAIAVELA